MISSPYAKPSITPGNEHPRLMLKKEDFHRIRNNMSLPECRKAYDFWQLLCSKDFSEFEEFIQQGKYNLLLCLVIEAKALRALLEDRQSEALEIVKTVMNVLENYSDSGKIFSARFAGHVIFVCALVYDWLYRYFKPSERTLFIERCENLAADTFEMGYPPAKQAAIGGHGNETQLLRDLLAFSIAVYDERPDIYNFCAGRILDEYVPTYKVVYAGEFHPQGPSYGAYRYSCGIWAQLLFLAMSGVRIFDENFENTADSFFYLLRPDGEFYRLGDDFHEHKGKHAFTSPATVPMFLAGALTGKARYRKYCMDHLEDVYLLPNKYERDFYLDGTYGEGILSATVFLIWNRFTEPWDTKELPKARHFGYPAGITIYKNKETGTGLLLKIGELWGSNHDHFDTGSFQIFHKKILASDSGTYRYYGTPHALNYCNKAIAHNCITITDPLKLGTSITYMGRQSCYDGGVRIPMGGEEPSHVAEWVENYRMAKVLSHCETENKVEIIGDLTEAYADTCTKVIRRMTYEPNSGVYGTLIVADEITSKNPEFIKQFHLHSQTEPEIQGNTITIRNGGGKLVCTVMQPEAFVIEKIGGAGKEYMVNGVNFPNTSPDMHMETAESGWGRITITPKEHHLTDNFEIRMEIQEIQ